MRGTPQASDVDRQRAPRIRARAGACPFAWTALGLVVAVLGQPAAVAEAQGADRIQVTVDRNQVTLRDQIYLTIRIEGSPDEPPRLPELPDFRVVSRGQQQQTQMVNFRVSHSVSYNYLLIPLRPGSFEIGPATARIDGEDVRSRPFVIQVADAEADDGQRNRDLFVTASVSTDRPWQGQQVIYTWRFLSRVPVGQGSIESMEFGSDVVAEDLGEVRQYTTAVDGVQYQVNELTKAIFPQRVGEIVLPPSQLRVEVQVAEQRRSARRRSIFDDFDDLLGRGGSWQTKYLVSAPLVLDVQPLPPPPEDWSGLIGEFEMSASLSRRELMVGQSATLQVAVRGVGNVQFLAEPRFPELPAFKVYPDQPTANVDRGGDQLAGSKVFRRALVPLVSGALSIPPLDLVYFDPEQGAYVTRSTDRVDLEVSPADGEEELMLTESLAPTTGKVAVRILADDILPIRRTAEGIVSAAPSGWRAWTWRFAGGLPPLIYLALFGYRRRERRYASDRTLRRRERALRRAFAATKRLPAELGAADAAEASRALRCYVGDKLGLEGAALTPAEAEQALLDAGVDTEAVRSCRRELERLEAAQFGASASTIPAGGLSDLIRMLDRRLGQRRTRLAVPAGPRGRTA